MNLYTEEQVKELLKQQRLNCVDEVEFDYELEDAKEPELPDPVFKWIPASKQPLEEVESPYEHSDHVLIAYEGNVSIGFFDYALFEWYDAMNYNNYDWGSPVKVTHWMELPNQPKEKEL